MSSPQYSLGTNSLCTIGLATVNGDFGGGSNVTTGDLVIRGNTNQKINMYCGTVTTPAMTIVNGNVGIQNTNPLSSLDMSGAIRSDGFYCGNVGGTTGTATLLPSTNKTNTGFVEFRTFNNIRAGYIGNAGNDNNGNPSGYLSLVCENSTAGLLVTSPGPALTLKNNAFTTQWRLGPANYGNDFFYVLNQSSNGVYIASGNNGWTSNSDERIKDIIEPITDGMNKVMNLRAIIGKFKTDEPDRRRSFLIAQDVQSVLPEAICENDGILGITHTDVIPLLVSAIKEQTLKIREHEMMIQSLEKRLTTLENK